MRKPKLIVNKHPGKECQYLYEELNTVLHRATREASLSYVNIIGVLEMLKEKIQNEYWQKYGKD